MKSLLSTTVLLFITYCVYGDESFTEKVGGSVTFKCIKSAFATVIWDRLQQTIGGAIAIGGTVQTDNTRYQLTVDGQLQQLTIVNINLNDDDIYRCYTLFQTDFVTFTLNIISKYIGFECTTFMLNVISKYRL